MRISRVRDVVLVVSLLSMPFVAAAACCPSDGNGIALAKSGMGESLPLAVNLSQDPNWLVYGFERDGISYYQVNDLAGQVRVIVGKIDDQFFTLPAGKSPARTSLPSQRLVVPGNAVRREVYRRAEFALVVYGEGNDAIWSVEVPANGG
ncbi:hypothetical protein [Stenotrophomonas rhizophila]|uniref:hypothetical protein n=1 Tax=Stenotrophomonas rhizophila TaxID=216778 RepID=UPI0028AA607A|nr:hypothetical protein [Stenotrophomonas rhizophila]